MLIFDSSIPETHRNSYFLCVTHILINKASGVYYKSPNARISIYYKWEDLIHGNAIGLYGAAGLFVLGD